MYVNTIQTLSFVNSFQKTDMKNGLKKSLEKMANHINEKAENNQMIEQKNFQNTKTETVFAVEQQKFMQSVEDIEKVDDKTTLKEFVAMLCSVSRTADNYMQEIEQFKNALKEYDSEIETYQEMINDPTKLKDELTISDAMDYLEQIKQKREEYVKEKGDNIQKRSEFHSALIKGVLGSGNIISQQQLDDMIFRKDSDDIMQELERVSKSVNSIQNSITDTLEHIMKKLKEKGEDVDMMLYDKYGQKDDMTLTLWEMQKKQKEVKLLV